MPLSMAGSAGELEVWLCGCTADRPSVFFTSLGESIGRATGEGGELLALGAAQVVAGQALSGRAGKPGGQGLRRRGKAWLPGGTGAGAAYE